ncbi:MAG: OB-fold domain-containing protein [candidate division NC10 bacterium]|nr:OB-fold domain-containing protein [candidate division NC10 bacterium]
MDPIPASKCHCGKISAPPAPFCPSCGKPMEECLLPTYGRILSYTVLYSPPEGFSSPLSIALVELEGRAKFLCHGEEKGLKIGRRVAIERLDEIYYFSTLSLRERAELFWRRRGETQQKLKAIIRSLSRRVRGSPPPGGIRAASQ